MPELAAEVTIDVPFHDIDIMEVAWHGHYVKYFELARCALLRKIGYDHPQMRESGYVWPVVECYLKYVRPARYNQRLSIRTVLREYENRLRFDYEIRDAASGVRLTRGYTVQVAVDSNSGELQFASPDCLIACVETTCTAR
ncbi:thioesterase family protein [Accumulibacter sp.]|uniref:acyl-CoA thioesterase n=1 Tax=Accumulibacter sp. TaxID=2053492 RepID=UPI0025E17DD7|nr:thioesterase family protein [Accumulibacter sp.]MCM8614099.1 acyl-CoA thioesterase [Accumulibacter sp.]MCM8637877.1 acyl-CoA thioesterase [Accumulibacter sp.]MCM8641284.1 acyl-CoA thioesterase [Accumulibacter sp.]